MKNQPKRYDVIVVGTGGASKLIAPVARLGYEVAVVENGPFGGTCLNRGCIPSKMLIHTADVAREIRDAHRFEIDVNPNFSVRFAELIKRVNNTVSSDAQRIEAAMKQAAGITVYRTTAEFVEPKVIKVDDELITADRIFLGAGARPSIPPIAGLAGTPYWTSTEALTAPFLPKRLIIIGGGYVSAELGHFFGALGSQVHLLVRSAMLGTEDRDVAAEFQRAFAAQHHVHLGVSPIKVEHTAGQFTVTIQDQAGSTSALTGDALLVATGLQPNSDLLHVERAGIETDERGFIQVDDYLKTTVERIWALGDVTGHYLFRHAVNFESNYLFRTLFAKPSDEPIVYPPVPHAIFSHPQVGSVGPTEEQLRQQGVDYVVGLNRYADSAMGMALRSEFGFAKLLFERASRRLLGAHIVGDHASTMIHQLIYALTFGATREQLTEMIYIHPALPEIVRNAAVNADFTKPTPKGGPSDWSPVKAHTT